MVLRKGLVFCWLHKLRNTQGEIYGTYLGNICGIYKEYIGNIHKYLWYKIIRTTGAAFGGRPIGSVFLIILYHKYLWIFLIHSLWIPYECPGYVPCIFHILSTFLLIFHICPHVVSILSTFWKLREVYMLKNTPHDSLLKMRKNQSK